jgi:hypothetical protein
MLKAYVPAVVELQAIVAVPEPMMLEGVMLPQVRPDKAVSVRLTVPAKPFRAVIVTVVVTEVPMVTAGGDADDIAKSATA